MALEKFGLGVILKMDHKQMKSALGQVTIMLKKFRDGIGRVAVKWAAFSNTIMAGAAKIRSGLAMIGSGMMQLAMGIAPFSIVTGIAIKSAAKFEHTMSGVGAVTQATAKEMADLSQEARRMGIISKFTNIEAAEGMELLGRAGASSGQIIKGISGVMAAAAADNLGMAETADIVTRSVKGLGLEWGEANHVADVLANTSASTNTNIRMLGEGFVYGVSQAKTMGIELEEFSAVLGTLANSGLQASIGGTAFMNMLLKMSAPTKKAQKFLNEFDIKLEKSDGSLRKISDIIQDVSQAMSTMTSVTKKTTMAKELFGRRGARAYGALATQGKKALDDLHKANLRSSEGVGVAAKMAAKRLDNLTGQITLLKGSLITLFTIFMGPALTPLTDLVKSVKEGLNAVLFTVEELTKVMGKQYRFAWKREEMEKKYGKTVVQVALGVIDAMTDVKETLQSVVDTMKKGSKSFANLFGGKDGVRNLTKFIIKATLFLGVLGPILLGLVMVKFAIGGLVSIVSGAISIFGGLITIIGGVLGIGVWPLIAAISVLTVGFRILKKENETWSEFAVRSFKGVKDAANTLWTKALEPMIDGFKEKFIPAFEEADEKFKESIDKNRGVLSRFGEQNDGIFSKLGAYLAEHSMGWDGAGRHFGSYVGYLYKKLVQARRYVFELGVVPVSHFVTIWKALRKGIKNFWSGDMIGGFKKFRQAAMDFLISPIHLLLDAFLKFAEMTGSNVPESSKKWVKNFGNAFNPDHGKQPPKTKKPQGRKRSAKDIVTDEVGFGEAPINEWDLHEFGLDPGQLGTTEMPSDAAMDAITAERKAEAKRLADLKTAADALKELAKSGIKPELHQKIKMCVDGEALNVASSRHKIEQKERSGGKFTPWQYQALTENGFDSGGID